MFKSIIYKYLFKAVLIALLGLVLYGFCSATALATILMLFVALRLGSLLGQAFAKPLTFEHWETMLIRLTNDYSKLTPEQRIAKAVARKLDSRLSAQELARAQVDAAIAAYVPPRSRSELAAEALGVITFALVIPVTVALYTRDIVSLRGGQGWAGALVAGLCVGLYAWPHCGMRASELSASRILWWTLPFAIAVPLLIHAVQTQHRYWDPFEPDHGRLAAERVLSLTNNVVAGQYADWVLSYAHQLDDRGEVRQAIHYYRESLRLDANNQAAYARLVVLESTTETNSGQIASPKTGPYWSARNPIIPPPRRQIDYHLDEVQGCTVVIVPVGSVSNELMDAIGFVITSELGLPVYVSTESVPIPPYTRKLGLAIGPQWNHAALIQAFLQTIKPLPPAPIRYLLVTPVDIYMDDTSYVVSTSFAWGAVLSSARFADPRGDARQGTAKQALCALIKSFGIPASPDRNDVTSYARSSAEASAKGTRPNAATMKLFQQAVAEINQNWRIQKVMKRSAAEGH